MKKSLLAKLCILSLVVVCAAMSFVACKVTTKSIAVNGKSQVFAGEFALADYSLTVTTSDGNTRTEPLTAQNLANVTVEQLQRAGMYNISVVYDGVTTAFALTVVNRTFDGLTFADKAVTYNGSAQSIEVANLPQGATVTYSPSNTCTNAGIYPVTATVSAPNFDTVTLSATLTINKATYDMSQVVFADKSVAYDGNAHSLEATNLPDGVTVTYIGNNQTNVGTYTVLAVFSGDSANYNPIANMTATLTVTQNKVQGVTFASRTVTYDGAAHSLAIEGNLPQGATVTYSPSNTCTNAGIYPVTATVSAPNFDTVTLSATLTINKASYDMSRVVFADKSVAYDGNAHSLEATNLPDGVTVTYIGNNQTNVGTYTVLAVFSGDSANYNPIANMTATLTVTQNKVQGVTFASRTVTYDGAAHSLAIEGNLPQDIAVVYEGNSQTNAGTYTVTAKFVGSNPNFEQLPDMSATLTIEKRELQIEFVGEQTAAYTGYVQNLLTARATNLCGSDTVAIDITYNGNVVDAGTYVATATVDSDNYKLTANNTCTFTITRATHKVTFRQNGQPDKVYNVLDLADFVEAFPDVVPVENYDVAWEEKQLTRVTEDVIVNAVITPTVYKITYILDGGTIPYNAPRQYTIETETFDLPVPQRDYYSFEGWYAEETFVNRVAQISQGSTGNVTLYAKWQQTSTEGLQYKQLSDGSYAVSGYKGDSAEVLIASVWCGQPVSAIGSQAFYYCRGLTSVIIGNSVTSIGDRAFYNCSKLTSVTIPDSVKSIGSSAFYGCSGLTSIKIPDSVTSIGWYAFSGCDGLTSVTIGNGVTSIGDRAFEGCDGLTSVTIGNGVTSIGDRAFEGCDGLTSVTIGNGVTSIGDWAFEGCYGLTEIRYNGDLTGWLNISDLDNLMAYGKSTKTLYTGGTKIEGDLVIPEDVKYIGSSAFSGCSGLTRVTIPDSVTGIGYGAFSGCSSLTEITLPFVGAMAKTESDTNQYPLGYIFGTSSYNGGVATTQCYYGDSTSSSTSSTYYIPSSLKAVTIKGGNILYGAFYNCSGLTSIKIPDSVTSIGNYAFYNCSKLTNITIPDRVTSIGDYTFYNCSKLTNITIPDRVTSIGDYTFYKCASLTSVTIPDSVTSIGNAAFYFCNGLTTVYWNATNCTKAGSNSSPIFSNCTRLKTVVVGENVQTIPSYAFSHCSGLTSIIIPDSVTSIGEYAFEGCSGLTSITISDNVSSIGNSAFYGCNGLTSVYWNAINCTLTGSIFTIWSNLYTVIIGENVQNIPGYAFDGCQKLTSITIPDSVTSIGSYAFSGCDGLTEIRYNGDLTGWCGISGLGNLMACGKSTKTLYIDGTKIEGDLVIPEGVTSIGNYAFYNCIELTSVKIPDNVTLIDSYAFSGCTGLTGIAIPNSIASIGDYAFNYCAWLTNVKIGSGIRSVGKGIFLDCASLTTVYWNATNCTKAGSNTSPIFSGCTSLKTVIIGENVQTIPDYAFYGCTGLRSISIPNRISSIGEYAFDGCKRLTSVTISSGVKSIGRSAFSNCTGLTTIYWNATNCTKAGSNTSPIFSGCTSLKTVIIGENVQTIPDYAFYGCTGLTSVTIPDSVTSIGSYAFSGCSGLTSVTIGKGVTSIGNYAFSGCSGLTSVTIPDSVTSIGEYAFYKCSGLTSITIGNGVTSIGEGAFFSCDGLSSLYWNATNCTAGSNQYHIFKNCAKLNTVVIGKNVQTIPAYAFYNCSAVTKIYYNGNLAGWCKISGLSSLMSEGGSTRVLYIAGTKIKGTLELPDGVTSISSFAFYNCSELTSITIPNSVTEIGYYAFSNCSELTNITIGDSVTFIGSEAFNHCSKLTSITIPDSVTQIGDGAFRNCSGLTSITIPDSVTSIGSDAFCNCSGLTSITIPDSVTSIGSYAFSGCDGLTEIRYNGDLTGWCGISGLGNLMKYGKSTNSLYIDGTKIEGDLVIPEGVTSIGSYAFYNCSILTSITIPNSVTQIGYMAFYNSDGLTEIRYNGDLTGWCGISGLGNLMKYGKSTNSLYIDGTKIEGDLVIPEGVTSIGSYAFYNCSILTSITIPNSVTQIGDSAFYNCSILRSIRFQGTKTEWAAITKGSSWNYHSGDYKVYCTNGMLSRSES